MRPLFDRDGFCSATADSSAQPDLHRVRLAEQFRSSRLKESERFNFRLRHLIEAARQEQLRRESHWARQLRQALEACQPHKSGKFQGTDTGYDPENHNANCRLGGHDSDKRPVSRSGQDTDERPSRAGHTPDKSREKDTKNAVGKLQTAFSRSVAIQSAISQSKSGKARALIGNDNEIRLANLLGPDHQRLPDSEPVDVVRRAKNCREDGYEVKTLITNQAGRIHMSAAQAHRKNSWSRGKIVGIKNPAARPDPSYDADCGRRVHVVVIDHREAYFNAVKRGADFNNRKLDNLYYARHARPWAVKQMIRCDTPSALKKLRDMPESQWQRTYNKYQGKSYPSGKPHPVVSKIVTGETTAQLRQLYADRKARADFAARRLAHWRRLDAEYRKEEISLLRRARKLHNAGKHGEVDSVINKADSARTRAATASRRVAQAEQKLQMRKAKLKLTIAKLRARKIKVGAWA